MRNVLILLASLVVTGCESTGAYEQPTEADVSVERHDQGHTPPGLAKDKEITECKTQGFWKNHPGEFTCDGLWLGDCFLTNAELEALLWMPTEGDASLILVHQLIAALFNVDSGFTNSDIEEVIAAAQAWLAEHGTCPPFDIDPSSEAGQEAVMLAELLDDFNNSGAECVDWELPEWWD